MKLNIFNIQHFSTGDGPGIRTTVFLGGCNLRCPWCHNPEALYGEPIIRELDEVVADVLSDREFYDKSGGGVTISGGEPLFSPDACSVLLERFKSEGLNTIVDTALSCEYPSEKILALTDCFFVDVKTASPAKFAELGGDFTRFKSNLDRLCASGASVVLRVPLIPNFNTDADSISALIAFIKPYGKPVTLLPFHRLGSAKYQNLGIAYAYANVEPYESEKINEYKRLFAAAGIEEADV